MNRLETLNKVNELLLTDLMDVRSKVKKKILEDFDKDVPTGDLIDQINLFMELTEKLKLEVRNKMKGINQHKLFAKENYERGKEK